MRRLHARLRGAVDAAADAKTLERVQGTLRRVYQHVPSAELVDLFDASTHAIVQKVGAADQDRIVGIWGMPRSVLSHEERGGTMDLLAMIDEALWVRATDGVIVRWSIPYRSDREYRDVAVDAGDERAVGRTDVVGRLARIEPVGMLTSVENVYFLSCLRPAVPPCDLVAMSKHGRRAPRTLLTSNRAPIALGSSSKGLTILWDRRGDGAPDGDVPTTKETNEAEAAPPSMATRAPATVACLAVGVIGAGGGLVFAPRRWRALAVMSALALGAAAAAGAALWLGGGDTVAIREEPHASPDASADAGGIASAAKRAASRFEFPGWDGQPDYAIYPGKLKLRASRGGPFESGRLVERDQMLYWISPDGTLSRARVDAPDASMRIAQHWVPAAGITTDEEHLYGFETTGAAIASLVQVTRNTYVKRELVKDVSDPRALAQDETYLYWAEARSGRIVRYRKKDGALLLFATGQAEPVGLAVLPGTHGYGKQGFVVWANAGDGTVHRASSH